VIRYRTNPLVWTFLAILLLGVAFNAGGQCAAHQLAEKNTERIEMLETHADAVDDRPPIQVYRDPNRPRVK